MFQHTLRTVETYFVPVHFVLFTERRLRRSLLETLIKWRQLTAGRLHYEVHVVSFPKDTPKERLPFFETCSSQKLYLPDLLPHIETLIYLDTNSLFLSPVEDIWRQFYEFNSSHIGAMVPELDLMLYRNSSGNKHYLKKCGLNVGMIMMNLTRMRQFHWTSKVISAYKDLKGVLVYDQDIINTIFSDNPNAVKILPVAYNQRITKCQKEINETEICANNSVHNGVFLIGRNKYPKDNSVFKALYKAINKTNIEEKLRFLLLSRMQRILKYTSLAGCPKERKALLRLAYISVTKKYKGAAVLKRMPNKTTSTTSSRPLLPALQWMVPEKDYDT